MLAFANRFSLDIQSLKTARCAQEDVHEQCCQQQFLSKRKACYGMTSVAVVKLSWWMASQIHE
jgi:hypothetical protein